MDPNWLQWAKRLQAIAQNGLAYADSPFDVERYQTLRDITVEIMAQYSDTDRRLVRDLFASESGYATPKVDVRGVAFRRDAILLVKEREDGLWTLPGGWADVDVSPSEAVVREVYEESGYRTRATKLLAVLDRNKHPHTPMPFHVYKLFFRCQLVGGKPSHSVETSDVGFFREGEIPALSISRVTPDQITRMFEHLRHHDWPTDFD